MLSIDRLPFPRKHKLKQSVVLVVVLMALFGLWLRSCNRTKMQEKVIVHSVNIDEFGSNYVKISFEIENKDSRDRSVKLLAKISDEQDEEIASKLFEITLKAKSKGIRSQTLDEVTRAIKEGERPHRATLRLY
ncbi:MAG: hypothetical protein ACOYIS_00635 [Candidatus Cloacimonadaceae bacterium]|jgi:hypothetical protein